MSTAGRRAVRRRLHFQVLRGDSANKCEFKNEPPQERGYCSRTIGLRGALGPAPLNDLRPDSRLPTTPQMNTPLLLQGRS